MLRMMLMLALLAVCTGATAQTAKKPKEKAMVKPLATTASPNPPAAFVPAFWQADALATTYLANRPEKVFKWLEEWVKDQSKSLPPIPDSFSTREEHEKYRSSMAQASTPGLLPLVMNCTKAYDPERQVFEVVFDFAMDIGGKARDGTAPSSKDYSVFRIPGGDSRLLDTYIAQNAFGASFTVKKWEASRYVLTVMFDGAQRDSIGREVAFVSEGGYPQVLQGSSLPHLYALTIPISSAIAREINNEITCLGVVSLSAPYLLYGNWRREATKDDLNDITNEVRGFVGKIDYLIVFNKSTGNIYSKHTRLGLSNVREEWVQIGKNESKALYMNRSTASKIGKRVRIWSLMDYKDEVYWSEGEKAFSVGDKISYVAPYRRDPGKFKSYKEDAEYDCEKQEYRRHSLGSYSGSMGVGKRVYDSPPIAGWLKVDVNTDRNLQLQVACSI